MERLKLLNAIGSDLGRVRDDVDEVMDDIEKVADLAILGLQLNGPAAADHKQWCLERILEKVKGTDALEAVRRDDPGIARGIPPNPDGSPLTS